VQSRRYTPHGPVLVWDPKHHMALSARWTAMEDDSISLKRMLGLERSTTAAEVCARFATVVTPCFNVVAADVNGDARYRSVGLLPVRAHVPGLGPIPSDGRYEWTGFVPADSMPQWRVPATGFVANANNRPVGPHYPYALPRFDWPHDRARRLAQRLEGDRSITVEDAASVQNDVLSLAADRNVRHLLECADSLWGLLPARARAACDTLRVWDLRATRSQVAPTLYRAWFGAYQRRTQLEGLPGLTLASLMSRAPETLRVPGKPGQFETPSVAACAALGTALDSLAAKLGPDLTTWRYGRAHQARFRHALSALDGRARWEPALTPEDGDNASPSVGPSRLPYSIEVTHGPAFRHVVDLARPLVSYGVVPPWNSAAFPPRGDVDLRGRWANHGYVPLLLDPARIDAVAIDRVTLAR
jgi:penicillin amidase